MPGASDRRMVADRVPCATPRRATTRVLLLAASLAFAAVVVVTTAEVAVADPPGECVVVDPATGTVSTDPEKCISDGDALP